MTNYLYDETFEGFLSCVYHHWYSGRADGILPERDYQLDLCRTAMSVETDPEKADRVLAAITKKISKWDAERVYRAFCTNEPEKEMKLLRYISLGFKRGPGIRLLHGDPTVKAVEAAEQRLGAEVHRLCGLIRFSEVKEPAGGNTMLYSKIEPDNDVLEFLAPHFSDRLKSEPIIIHDLRRGKALFAFGRKWEVAPLVSGAMEAGAMETSAVDAGAIGSAGAGANENRGAAAPLLEHTDRESDYRLLWKRYFDIMATRERVNPGCQRRFMPARYWKHLPEIEG